jgi:hypothetical protein
MEERLELEELDDDVMTDNSFGNNCATSIYGRVGRDD